MSDRRVHYQRLHEAPPRLVYVRLAARAFCHALVGLIEFLRSVAERFGPPAEHPPISRPARVVLTGTFFADNWVEAHVRPLALSDRVDQVWVVADRRFVPMEKVTYVCPPAWLQRCVGRVLARSLTFTIIAVAQRADFVGGFHLLCNGLLALTVARMIGARAMYFCVGGWAEFVQGGVHGGNHVFTMIAHEDLSLERALLRAVRRFDVVLTMGTGARELLRTRGVSAPIHVMPGGIDAAFAAAIVGPKRYDLVTVSRLAPVKRLDVFLEVVRRLVEVMPSLRAVIVGDGPEMGRLQRRATELQVSGHVEFAGRQVNVAPWLASSRVFVLTSDSEGLSLALMEATMAGLPAVVSDVGDLGDLVAEGANGWRPPPRDVAGFTARLRPLLNDPALYERTSGAARRAAGDYTIETMRERWNRILAPWVAARTATEASNAWTRQGGAWLSRKTLWEKSRAITRRPAARGLSCVPPGMWLGRGFRRQLRFVEETEHWDPARIREWQLARLRQLIAWAYERSPYYRRAYRERGFAPGDLKELTDLAALPPIGSDAVRAHLRALCTDQSPTVRGDAIATGGTGGRPLSFFINADRSAVEYAHLVASWKRAGYALDFPLAVFRGRSVSVDASGLRHEYEPFLRHHIYSTFHMTDEYLRDAVEHIRSLGPCYLHVYPSAVAAFARFLRRSGLAPPANVRGVLAESEIVYPDQRKMVEETLGCRYFSCYGHSEKAVAAAECEFGKQYHVWPTYGYFELIGADGRPVETPGERGEIVATSFINTVTPFIRYRTGDWATWVGDRCEGCGRNHPVISDIRGHRIQESLIAADGSEIPWAALNMHDDTFVQVSQFQFQQNRPGHAVLLLVPGDGQGELNWLKIRETLERRLDGRITLEVELRDQLQPSSRGKFIYVDQRIPERRPADELWANVCPDSVSRAHSN